MEVKTQVYIIAPFLCEEGGNKEFKSRENLGISYLTSYLKSKNLATKMINAHDRCWDNEKVISYLLKEPKAKVYGISCTSQRLYPYAKDLTIKIRAAFPNAHITMGGIFPSMEFDKILDDLPELDTITVGEGEIPLHKLCKAVINNNIEEFTEISSLVYRKGNKIIYNPVDDVRNYDGRPFPEREKINFDKYEEKFLRLLGGRGCYGRCSFCSTIKCYDYLHQNKGKVYRDPNDIISEIKLLIKNTGIYSFSFYDDIFYDRSKRGKAWVHKLCNLIKENKLNIDFNIKMRCDDIFEDEIKVLKEAGLTTVFLGVESGVQRILDEMNKGITVETNINAIKVLRKYKIRIVYGFMGIVPTMSFEELQENLNFLISIGGYTERNLYNKLNLYSGCEYNNILEKKGLLIKQNNFWERNNYKYFDERVELYSDVVDILKSKLKETKVKLNRIKLYSLNENQYKLNYLNIENKYTLWWKDILLLLIDEIKCKNILTPQLTYSINDSIEEIISYIDREYSKVSDSINVIDISEMDKEVDGEM